MSARHEAGTHKLTIDEIAAISTSLAAAIAEAFTDETDAFSLAKFCRRHGISLQMYYKLVQQDLAPVTFNIGTRVLVSREAAARWRAEREEASAAKAVKAAAAIADELCEGKTVRTTPEADAKWRAKREGAAVASGTAGPINSDTTA